MRSANEMVLLYNIQPAERRAIIAALLDRLSMPHKEISVADADQSLGYLLGRNGFLENSSASSSDQAPRGEMMILGGLSELRLDALLKALRTCGAAPVALKAVATDTNILWSLKTLYGHLVMEHIQIQQAKQNRSAQS
ncbi:MAG: DUF3783 domain-containing protein [Clostridiales bacterium]|nr:DUF3783 domain-containing protein [Clostridiales bacterium]